MIEAKIYHLQYDFGIENVKDPEFSYDKILAKDDKFVKYNGNLEYLIHTYQTGKLLDNNQNQGYHPPLHHFISAGVMNICKAFGASSEFIVESAEFPAFVYSVGTLVIMYLLTKELELDEDSKILVMALASFSPLLIFLSRLINNDPLVTLCTVITLLILIKWYKNPSMKHTIFLALSIGLGASCKTSILVMMLTALVVYIYKISNELQNKEVLKKLAIYGIVFSIISAPLTFWYPIRNALKFGQPMFAVIHAAPEYDLAKTDFANRWLLNNELFALTLKHDASNVLAYVINSSIVFMVDLYYMSPLLLFAMKFITIALMIVFLISLIKNIKGDFINTILLVTVVSWIISFIGFNISLPSSCTMHSRYIVIVFEIAMIYIAKLYQDLKNQKAKKLIEFLVWAYAFGGLLEFITILTIL